MSTFVSYLYPLYISGAMYPIDPHLLFSKGSLSAITENPKSTIFNCNLSDPLFCYESQILQNNILWFKISMYNILTMTIA